MLLDKGYLRSEEWVKLKTVTMSKVNLSKSIVIGASFLLLSALLTSISQVYYASQVQGVHPFLFTGVSFLLQH